MSTLTRASSVGIRDKSSTGIRIVEVRIRNFRCLEEVDVTLDSITVLIGENNAGKSSFIDAIHAAIGVGSRVISEEDIFLKSKETHPPKERVVTIDILIRPTDNDNKICDSFPAGSAWLQLWGNGVQQNDEGDDYVALRTQMKWDKLKGEYVTDRRFIRDWQTDSKKWNDAAIAEKAGTIGSIQIEPLAIYCLDAKRDIADDIHSRSSFWSKMVADLGLSQEDVEEIEKSLTDINTRIISGSNVLVHVQSHLNTFDQTLTCERDSVTIAPITRHIRDLHKGIDVLLSTKDAPAFSLGRQGMGTRSLGTLLAFRAYMTWRMKRAGTSAIHPMVAIEEPEAHLHPQAQRALYHQIANIPGQRIISTHSPYICAQARSEQFRHFLKLRNVTSINQLNVDDLEPEDIRKINREVMNTKGDILFARCVVLFEGDTEEQALPELAKHYWNCAPGALGISFVGVGGYGGYIPFLRLASSFRIPWFIFSDGEPEAREAVNNALQKVSEPIIPLNQNVKVIPDCNLIKDDFEAYLVTSCRTVVVKMIIDSKATTERHRIALNAEWSAKSDTELVNELRIKKTHYGSLIGAAIVSCQEGDQRLPPLILDLFTAISNALELTAIGGCDQ